ncbi:hypothetical protein C8Q76DRAFT_257042 [Earliella scabrosa]|nr:hypothetical protein C8Q76DRAFT_257042 [Earliella scabrosa]
MYQPSRIYHPRYRSPPPTRMRRLVLSPLAIVAQIWLATYLTLAISTAVHAAGTRPLNTHVIVNGVARQTSLSDEIAQPTPDATEDSSGTPINNDLSSNGCTSILESGGPTPFTSSCSPYVRKRGEDPSTGAPTSDSSSSQSSTQTPSSSTPAPDTSNTLSRSAPDSSPSNYSSTASSTESTSPTMTNSTNFSSTSDSANSSASTPPSSSCPHTITPEPCDPSPSPIVPSSNPPATTTSLINPAPTSPTATSAHRSNASSTVPLFSVSSSPAPTANSGADAVEGQHAQTGLGGGAIAGIVLGSAVLLCIGGVLLYKVCAWSKRGSEKDTGRDGWSESTQYLGAFGWEKDEHEDMDDDSIGIAL